MTSLKRLSCLVGEPYLATPGTDSCWQTWHNSSVQRLHHRQSWSHGAEGWKNASEDNKWMIVQCATFSKSLNPRNIDKIVSDIRIRIQFPFQSSFWISLSGCKLTIQPDIQLANRIVIISVIHASKERKSVSNLSFVLFIAVMLAWPWQYFHFFAGTLQWKYLFY